MIGAAFGLGGAAAAGLTCVRIWVAVGDPVCPGRAAAAGGLGTISRARVRDVGFSGSDGPESIATMFSIEGLISSDIEVSPR